MVDSHDGGVLTEEQTFSRPNRLHNRNLWISESSRMQLSNSALFFLKLAACAKPINMQRVVKPPRLLDVCIVRMRSSFRKAF